MKKNLLFSALITGVCILPSVVFQVRAMTPGTQGIFISAVENDTLCAGDAIAIDFNCSGLTPTGTLSVELSDASGSFAAPVIIATVAGSASGTINATVPANTPMGSAYRVRITSSAPVFTGSPNGVNIRVYALPEPVITADGPPELCDGDTIVLSVIGEFECFLWTSGSTTPTIYVTESGQYQIYVCDSNGCMASTPPLDVSFHSLPGAIIYPSGPSEICTGECITLGAVDDPNSLVLPSWSNGSSNLETQICDSGTVILTVTDNHGCVSRDTTTITINADTIDCPTGLSELSANTLGIYPNPAGDVLTISTVVSGPSSLVFIHNTLGQVLIQKQVTQNTIDISSLSSGLYFITLDDGEVQRSARFVKATD